MALPAPSDVKARFPEFASLDNSVVQLGLNHAALFVDDRVWRASDVNVAIIYLAAHLLFRSLAAMSSGSGSGGTGGTGDVETFLSSVSFGDRTVAFRQANAAMMQITNAESGGGSDFSTTPYGKMYLALRRRNVLGGGLVV